MPGEHQEHSGAVDGLPVAKECESRPLLVEMSVAELVCRESALHPRPPNKVAIRKVERKEEDYKRLIPGPVWRRQADVERAMEVAKLKRAAAISAKRGLVVEEVPAHAYDKEYMGAA